ncbi:MAG: Holliday junction resolvase RuvX [Candidatus Krumholzibacteria bacterium]|nr:Holliday junction resolvase RuvX [Candidatus Krumholzibacteria bacterium]
MAEGDRKAGRVLAIDPGSKRTGLAMSDPLGMTAQGLDTFETGSGKDLLDHLGELIELHGIDRVVVGLPLSMQGKDIEGSGRSRTLAARIMQRFGLAVHLMDERMTSLEAERVLRSGDRGFERGDIDKLSAMLLLQSYLDERPKR